MPGGRRAPVDRALREYARVRRHVGPGRAISLDEAVHVAQRLSRRDFLRLSGIAGAGALLASCDPGGSSDPAPTTGVAPTVAGGDGPRVVIVGAGLAGMTAAYRLHQAGLQPLVFEARDRVGGRCWSARDWDGRQVAEHGGEFVDTRHVHMRVLVDELGLELDDLWSAWVPGSTWLSYVDGEIVKARNEFQLMAPAIDEVVALAATGPLEAGASPPEIVAFDEMSAADWYTADVGSASTGLYRLWTQRLAGWYGLDPAQLGAGNLIDFYAIDSPGGDERYTVRGGNDQVPARILDELPEGTVTYEAPLEAVRAASDGAIELRFGGVAAPVVADRVILAVPFTTLRQVDLDDAGFSDAMREAVDELGMGTNAKVLMQFDRPFYTGFGDWSGGMNRADEPILGTWESGGTDGADGLGLLTVYSGGHVGAGYAAAEPHAAADQEVIDDTLTALDQVVPGVAAAFNGRAWLDSWVQDPWVGGSYAAFLPGQLTRFWGATSQPQGSAHLAGEQTSTYSQGFLNGGVESGSRAAAEVLETLGLPLPAGLERSNRLARRFQPAFPWPEVP